MTTAQDRLREEMDNPGVGGIPRAADTYMPGVSGPPRRALNQQAAERIVQVIPENALVQESDGTITMGNYTLTGVGLIASDAATYDQWSAVGEVLHKLNMSLQWLIGDWVDQGEFRWGVTYKAIAAQTGYEPKTLREYKYVCSRVHLSIRMDKLSFGHHQLVAKLPQDEQVQWLEWAVNCTPIPSVSEMRKAMRGKSDKPNLPERVAEALDDLHHSYVFLRDSWRPDMDEESRSLLVEHLAQIEAQAQALRAALIG